jgi:hypothetical protein
MAIDPDLIDTVRRYDARIGQLQNYGIDFDIPGWWPRMQARTEAMAAMYEEEQRVREEVSEMLPHLLDAYTNGSPQDRQELRNLLDECRSFGGKQNEIKPELPVTAESLRKELIFMSMRDGDPDWRDETVWLDNLCATGIAAGLDLPALLGEAAALSSTAGRDGRPSLQDILLVRAANGGRMSARKPR